MSNEYEIKCVLYKIMRESRATSLTIGKRNTSDFGISYSLYRDDSGQCAAGGIHNTNGGYLMLNTRGSKPIVKMNCMSTDCGKGKNPITIDCKELAIEWSKLEGVKFKERDKFDFDLTNL